jgi:uncharacterized protein YndB with AHSA1/START domain
MSELAWSLERTIVIRARRATVFRYFTDPARFAAWWGKGSEIDARVGGRVSIRFPNDVRVGGEVLELEPPGRIVFSYGYEGGRHAIPPGGSRVSITLEELPEGTRLQLRHELATQAGRDMHVQGWRYQLALFANVVSAEEHAAAAERVDALFSAWAEADGGARRALLDQAVTPGVVFRDAHSATTGIDDLHAHLAAAQLHMPGIRLAREGELQQCQGTAVARWVATAADGGVKARGTNVYELAPDGRIDRVVGMWG